jgi:hypothetical protein
MSERWNNQTQNWETYDENGDVVEAKEELVAPETVELPSLETVVELPPVKESVKNVELVELPIEVVNAKPSHFGFEAWHGVLGIIVLIIAWRWLKK